MRKNPLSNMSAHGGIITSEFLEIILGEKVANPQVQPESFVTFNASAPRNKAELDQRIVDSWDRLRERWDSLSSRYLKINVSDARSKWMVPLFKELGFDPGFIKEDIVVDGDDKLRFRLSHRGWISAGAPMLHMVAPAQDLEEAGEGAEGEVVRRGRSRSPHDELQAYLNATKGSKWGIVTNGVLLRILREYYHTTTKGYVEFDIENIFRERSFTDFRALYRMAHASRFLPDKDGVCPLEQFYKESVAAGVTVGENLRRNVKKSIEALGNGFLTPELTKKMIEDEEFCKTYYSELLRVIYRLLFLLFAEQRAMLPTRDSLYAEEYSITRLREMAETRRGKDDHFDLWEGLKATFHMLKKGCPPLKVFGYNGSLFDDSEIAILSQLSCKNEDVLEAIRHLTMVEEERVLKRINYLDLGVSEIGSIYESLLDYTPKVFATEQEIEEEPVAANTFVLDPRSAARKTSGSYYTSPRLIDELIKSALKPVAEHRLSKTAEKEKALLSIKVCDPACGSGAFLIAANNFLAKELAKLRTNQVDPSDKEVKKAARDVLQHCIYGVDLNPMATELAKVSLWINSCVEDMPLNFLDHHIKCGNSLIGATPELLKLGIPDRAFWAVEGDNKNFAKKIRLQNSFERKQTIMAEFDSAEQMAYAKEYASIDELAEKSTSDIEEKRKKYENLVSSSSWNLQKFFADAWAASFFWSLNEDEAPPCTQAKFRLIQKNGSKTIAARTVEQIKKLAEQFHFFHWFAEFPDVFGKQKAGFDCLIGNPPWERIKIQDREFFSATKPDIVSLPAARRRQKIRELPQSDPKLWRLYVQTRRNSETLGKYVRESGRFPLTSKGDINTYALFAENSLLSISQICGYAGIIVPTGLATDDTNKDFFAELVSNMKLVSLFDFENRLGLFPEVHRLYKFSLLTMSNLENKSPEFAFFLTNLDQLEEKQRMFKLTAKDLQLLNPNSRTCPIFRTQQEASIVIGIYQRIPILIDEKNENNPWGAYYMRLVDLDDYADSVFTADDLLKKGCVRQERLYQDGDGNSYLPLYESKLIHQFDHRFATFEGCTKDEIASGYPRETSPAEHEDFDFEAIPRYWIPEKLHLTLMKKYAHGRKWLLVYRDVTGATNQHTAISTIIPMFPATRTLPAMGLSKPEKAPFLLANLNSLVFDFLSRVKVSGMHLNFAVMKQLPIIPPEAYDTLPNETKSRIVYCSVRLTYTSNCLREFAAEHGFIGSPIKWSLTERTDLMCELSAIYCHLYGLTRDELLYVLDTFNALKDNEIRNKGEFEIGRLILGHYDNYMGKLSPLKLIKKKSEELRKNEPV